MRGPHHFIIHKVQTGVKYAQGLYHKFCGLVERPWSNRMGGESLRRFFLWGYLMRELSIFVDESGDFGKYAKHSPYYAVSMVFHDQSFDISKPLELLDKNLLNMGYGDVAIHTEPLIQREEIYKNVEPNERRSLFTKLFYFVLHSNIKYRTFIYEKITLKMK